MGYSSMVMETVETAGGIVMDSRDSWRSLVGIQAGGEIHKLVVGVGGSWPWGLNEWTKTTMS